MPKFDLGRVVATPGALRAIRSSGRAGNTRSSPGREDGFRRMNFSVATPC